MSIENKTVVSIRTSRWADSNGFYIKKTVRYLKRKCSGLNAIEEDIQCAGAEDAILSIDNLDKCEDGEYELVFVPGARDYETGFIDDWSYILKPLK